MNVNPFTDTTTVYLSQAFGIAIFQTAANGVRQGEWYKIRQPTL
jgi:hypothetical protein